jgi:hypothetical protein
MIIVVSGLSVQGTSGRELRAIDWRSMRKGKAAQNRVPARSMKGCGFKIEFGFLYKNKKVKLGSSRHAGGFWENTG